MNLSEIIPAGFDCIVYEVPSGTVIDKDNDGNDMVVTDTTVVNIGNKWWVTQPIFLQIKKMSQKRAS